LEISLYNEFKRKLIHLFALSIPIGYYLLPKRTALLILIPITLGSIIVDIIRLRNLPLAGFFNWLLGPILREHESWDLTGSSYILSASVLSIILYSYPNKKVAIAAISYIILGDCASAIVGRVYGQTKIEKKSLEGSLAFLSICLLVALLLPGLPFWVGAIGALIATGVEALSIPLNDNLSVPLASGLIMEILILL
jgi:glycerol-3-phosphate acyltransferase PlsY